MQHHSPPLTLPERLNFGVGQIAEGVKTCSFGTYLLFYYNQVLGLAADLAGLAIALALVFDAVTDPIAGSVSDRWQSPRGRRHPFLYVSALPLGIAFWLLFAPWVDVDSAGQYGLFAWMLGCTVLTRGAMTLYHVPHMALGAELSSDYEERTVLVALRHFFGATGYIIVYVLGFGYFFAATDEFPRGQLNPAAYPPYAITLAVIMMASILITAYGTRSRIPYLPKAREVEERVTAADVIRETLQAMKNPSFRWMMFGFILIIIAFGVAGATGLYVYTFFWQLDQVQILLVLVMLPVGSMVGYAFSKPFFSWLDKRNAMIVGGIAWMIIHASPVLLFIAGYAPAPGSWGAAWFMVAVVILGGATVGQVIVGIGTGMADIADENELATGRRQEGVFFGASAFANKCSAALGSYVAGLVLVYIEWPTGSDIRSAADISADTLLQLGIWSGPVAALLAIPGLVCLYGYSLNRDRVAEIQSELRARAAAPGA